MAITADILLEVTTTKAERQVLRVQKRIEKIEDTTRTILGIDRQILGERRKLLTLQGESARKAQDRIKALSLQKRELQLQKTELAQINRLEKQRTSNLNRAFGISGSGGGDGLDPLALAGIGAAAAARMTPKQIFEQGDMLGQLKVDRDRISDALDATQDEIEAGTKKVQAALAKYRKTVSKFGGASPQAAMSRNVGVRPKLDALRDAKTADVFGRSRLNQIDTTISSINKAQDELSRQAAKSASGISTLGKQVLITAGAYLTFDTAVRQASAAINKSVQASSNVQRLEALSSSYDNLASVLGAAEQAAERFNISTLQSQQQFAQLYGRLRPLGLTLEEVQTVFEGFSTAAALTGATAAESSGALLQLSQALGSGALRGEEFNSVAEQAPAVLQAIATEIGKPIGQLKQLAKDGAITSDIVVSALARIRTEGADKLAEALDTPAQKVKTLQNRFEDLQIALGNIALPTFIGVVDELTEAIENMSLAIEGANGLLDDMAPLLRGVEGAVDDLKDPMRDVGKLLEVALATGFQVAGVGADDFRGKLRQLGIESEDIYPKLLKLGGLMGRFQQAKTFAELGLAALRARGASDPISDYDRTQGADMDFAELQRIAREASRPLRDRLGIVDELDTGSGSGRRTGGRTGPSPEEILQRQIETGEEIRQRLERSIALSAQPSDFPRELVRITQELEDVLTEIEDGAEESQKSTLENLARTEAAIQGIGAALDVTGVLFERVRETDALYADTTERFRNFFKQNQQVNEELTETEKLLKGSYDIVANRLTTGIEGLIRGTSTLRDIFADIASSLGRMFLNAAFSSLGSALKIPGMASGGLVTRPTLAMVGEGGEPEYVIPASKMASAARNYAEGDRGPSILNEDGGMFSRYSAGATTSAARIEYSGPVLNFNSEEYVPKSAIPDIIESAASRGESNALKRLQQSRGTRSRLGM